MINPSTWFHCLHSLWQRAESWEWHVVERAWQHRLRQTACHLLLWLGSALCRFPLKMAHARGNTTNHIRVKTLAKCKQEMLPMLLKAFYKISTLVITSHQTYHITLHIDREICHVHTCLLQGQGVLSINTVQGALWPVILRSSCSWKKFKTREKAF